MLARGRRKHKRALTSVQIYKCQYPECIYDGIFMACKGMEKINYYLCPKHLTAFRNLPYNMHHDIPWQPQVCRRVHVDYHPQYKT